MIAAHVKSARVILLSACALVATAGCGQMFSSPPPRKPAASANVGTDARWFDDYDVVGVSGYAPPPADDVRQQVTLQWGKLEFDPLGEVLTVHGLLLRADVGDAQATEATGSKAGAPVDWLQGLTVLMAVAPERSPNWMRGAATTSVHGCGLVERDGRFSIRLQLDELQYDRAVANRFQFGIALADQVEHSPNNLSVLWSSEDQVLPQTVTMLSVPPVPQLAPPLLALKRHGSGCTEIISAVNALHALGKDQAIQTIEEYLALRADQDANRRGSMSHEDNVVWVLRLLFSPDGAENLPPRETVSFLESDGFPAMGGPLELQAVVNDIPFALSNARRGGSILSSNSSGSLSELEQHMVWAKDQGTLRKLPLTPTSNPIVAVENLAKSERFSKLAPNTRQAFLTAARSQAIGMLQGVVPDLPQRTDFLSTTKVDLEWTSLLRRTADMEIVWDVKQQRFVVK